MTEDTKKALEIIKPIADELNIKVSADDDILYIDNIGVAIGCNSTYATLMEFIGYLTLKYNSKFRFIYLSQEQIDSIKTYYYSEALIKKRAMRKKELVEGKSKGEANGEF